MVDEESFYALSSIGEALSRMAPRPDADASILYRDSLHVQKEHFAAVISMSVVELRMNGEYYADMLGGTIQMVIILTKLVEYNGGDVPRGALRQPHRAVRILCPSDRASSHRAIRQGIKFFEEDFDPRAHLEMVLDQMAGPIPEDTRDDADVPF